MHKNALALLFSGLALLAGPVHAQVFSWVNEHGQTVFGDKPPANAKKKQSMKLPEIMVVDAYKASPLPTLSKELQAKVDGKTVRRQTASLPSTHAAPKAPKNDAKPTSSKYTNFNIMAPQANQTMRTETGDVTVAIATSPKLKPGHQLRVKIDKRKPKMSKIRMVNIEGLNSGKHQLKVELIDKQSRVLHSKSVSFNVKR